MKLAKTFYMFSDTIIFPLFSLKKQVTLIPSNQYVYKYIHLDSRNQRFFFYLSFRNFTVNLIISFNFFILFRDKQSGTKRKRFFVYDIFSLKVIRRSYHISKQPFRYLNTYTHLLLI